MSVSHRLAPLFNFASVAVVGASDNNPTGARPYQALQALGFTGRYYPVNARNDQVQGMRAYPNVSSLPEPPDMVVIVIPAAGVPAVIDECARTGVKAAVILAAGFVDRDARGAELQARITATARESGLLVVGPNCLGLASAVHRCAACSASPPTRPGNVALVSHSGGLMNEVITSGVPRGIGFSHVVSAGNEAGVTAADYIDFFVDDPSTDVVLGILETARDPAGFVAATSRALTARKPVVILKMGWSAKGARSAFTHTGAVAGDDAVYGALFRQQGVIRVNDIDELVDMGALLSASIGVLRGHRLERAAIIEISGGGKGLVCDTAAAAGVRLSELSEAAVGVLTRDLPEETYPTNPIDTGGSWVQPDKAEVFPATLDVFASEPDVDVVVSRFTIPRTGELGVLRERIAELEAARSAHPDRLFPVLSRTCDQYCEEWEAVIRERRIPFLQGYGRGLRALGLMAEYSRAVHGSAGPTGGTDTLPLSNESDMVSPLATEVGDGARMMDDVEARELLATVGIAIQPSPQAGLEIVIGAHRDAQFGPVISFGLGGDLGEVLDDEALRLAPLSEEDAAAMLREIRGHRLLDGGRGRPAVDRAALRGALCALSGLMLRRPDVASVRLDPAFANGNGVTATHAEIQLSGNDG